MDTISNVTVEPCTNSKYIKPRRIHYRQNGIDKIWDAMKVHDGVVILVFNKTRNVFVFVKQFRPAIYINAVKTEMKDGCETVDTSKYPGSMGIAIELCAGIIDKDLPIVEIAKMEVLEECGYDVPLESLRKITSCRGGVGTSGSNIHLYYAEVTDEIKKTSGGGLVAEGELIEVVEASIDEARNMMFDESINRVASLMFCLYWFFDTVWK